MLFYLVLGFLACTTRPVCSLICRHCVNLNLDSSLIHLPDIFKDKACFDQTCSSGESCFGLKVDVDANIPIAGKQSTSGTIQGCMADPNNNRSPVPTCTHANMGEYRMFSGILSSNVYGMVCFCDQDYCDSICEHGYLIGDKCTPGWMIAVISISVVAFVAFILTCCCCCCCGCCRRSRVVVQPVAANPQIIVVETASTSSQRDQMPMYQPQYQQPVNPAPAYDYVNNDDEPLIKA